MAVADGRGVLVYKEMGLVSQVFDEPTLATLQGHLAIGHTRYSTTGGSRWENAQPAFKTNAAGAGSPWPTTATSPTRPRWPRRSARRAGRRRGRAAAEQRHRRDGRAAGPRGRPVAGGGHRPHHGPPRGAFSLVIMDERTLYGVRDRHGVRPLCIGKLPGAG